MVHIWRIYRLMQDILILSQMSSGSSARRIVSCPEMIDACNKICLSHQVTGETCHFPFIFLLIT